MTAPTDPSPSLPKPVWSGEARSVASLLLFVHLFAVVVTVTAYTQPSFLQQQLQELFDPYLRNLHLTAYPVSYPFARYHLTHGLPSDVDTTCQVQFPDAEGKQQTVTIPPPGLQPAVRYRRYQMLANAAGTLAQDELSEDAGGILPKAIGGSILKRHGVAEGVIRLQAHDQPLIDEMSNLESGRREPVERYRDVYEAEVFVRSGRVDILRKSTTLEVAPAETTPARSGAPQRRTPSKRSE